MYFTTIGGSQSMFFLSIRNCYVRTKKDKNGTDYVLSWESDGVYNSKLKLLYTAFFHSIKRSGYKMGIKFHKVPLAVEQNNYLTKIGIVDIAYNLTA